MMDYKDAYLELAAQVRRLGFIADVQEDDNGYYFGDEDKGEHQIMLSILATVGKLRHIETIIEHDKQDIPF